METYSSPSSPASSSAAFRALTASLLNCGFAIFAPLADGYPATNSLARVKTPEGLTPAASSSGAAIPSFCSSSATRMCPGRISGLPALVAAFIASWRTSPVLVVGVKLITCAPLTQLCHSLPITHSALSLFHSTSNFSISDCDSHHIYSKKD